MKLLSPFIDRLQATFPPNRICILLAGPIVTASAWLSAIAAANIPGVELPVGVVAGIIGAAVLIVVTLLYKWFDQWQAGEPVNAQADLEAAYDEIESNHELIDRLAGASGGIQEVVKSLHSRVADSTISPAEVSEELAAIWHGVDQILVEHGVKASQEELVDPVPDAVSPAATAAE